ncbi:MAG: hypothetical protein D6730_05740 [Bacteroidetes bacterium]|nr:MAG: hypothetical protein D6730_05740 [Bacteroidota bacterium]
MDFKVESSKLYCLQTREHIPQSQISIDEYHFFDGAEAPNDMQLVMAVNCDNGLRGILRSTYSGCHHLFIQTLPEC